MSRSLSQLEQIIGYQFTDAALLERAVTHRSWAYEQLPVGDEAMVRRRHNESLEFVGDAVLGLVVAEYLFIKNPEMSEGDLTLMKHHLVSTGTLAQVAQSLKLGDFMRVGRGEEKTGGRRKQALLADMLEAVIGAIFFDTGYEAARGFITRGFADEFNAASPTTSIDYKTLLQETLQADKRAAPAYRVVETEGPPHDRTFFVEVSWNSGQVCGRGSSIKSAEMQAASLALQILNEEKSEQEAKNTTEG